MIKLSTIDNFLISFLMLATISPVFFAKVFVIIAHILIFFRILKDNKIYVNHNRMFIFSLIFPGIILTLFHSPQDLIRFIIILFIIFRFPFSEFRLNKKSMYNLSILILFYLILTQILISFRIEGLVSFRDIWYTSEFSHIFDHQNFIDFKHKQSVLDLIGKYRLGGLFHNPNLLAMIVLLYFFIFNTCYFSLNRKNKFIYFLVFSITITSLILTYSRTAIAGFIVFILLQNINFKRLVNLKINIRTIPILLFIIFLGTFMLEVFLNAFESNESGFIKIGIIINFLKTAYVHEILFGGVHKIMFDSDLGNWLGAFGFIGFAGYLLLFRNIVIINNSLLPFIIALILMSIGNTIFYGLLTANICLVYLIINSSENKKAVYSIK